MRTAALPPEDGGLRSPTGVATTRERRLAVCWVGPGAPAGAGGEGVSDATSAKLLISGAEEPTTFQTSDMVMSNMPPWLALMLVFSGSLRDYFRRPLPRPVGVIEGSAVSQANAKAIPDAVLPADVETTDTPLEVPADAASPSLTPLTGALTMTGERPKVP